MDENEEPRKPLVGLFGTCNNSTWRDRVIPLLKVEYYNPVVTGRPWTPDDARIEEQVKKLADILLYVITPLQTGFYSIAEMTYSAIKAKDKKVIIVFLNEDDGLSFTVSQSRSNAEIVTLLKDESNVSFTNSLAEVVELINNE